MVFQSSFPPTQTKHVATPLSSSLPFLKEQQTQILDAVLHNATWFLNHSFLH
jgi:hypothetical protein